MTRKEIEKAIADGTPLAVEDTGSLVRRIEIRELLPRRAVVYDSADPLARTWSVAFGQIITLEQEQQRADRERARERARAILADRTQQAAVALRTYEPAGVRPATGHSHGLVYVHVDTIEHLLRLLAEKEGA